MELGIWRLTNIDRLPIAWDKCIISIAARINVSACNYSAAWQVAREQNLVSGIHARAPSVITANHIPGLRSRSTVRIVKLRAHKQVRITRAR